MYAGKANRFMAKLNAAKIRTLTKPGVYGDGAGLYIQVRGADQRSWRYRFKLHGAGHLMGLGSLADVTLAEAREAATVARKLVRQGVNPIDRRKAERAGVAARIGLNTFSEMAEAYIKAHEDGWRNAKHKYQWRATIDAYAAPILGDIPVAEIAVGDVMRVLQPIWKEKTETASRLRGRIEAVLGFATARGWRAGDNPARWHGHLSNLLPAPGKASKVQNQPALPWKEIGTFMDALAKEEGMAKLALRFAILTAARTNEVIGARWCEIDRTEAVWIVPADRMKANREHRVPLSADALAVLSAAEVHRRVQTPDAPVFPARNGKDHLSNMALLMLVRRMNSHTEEAPARWRDGKSGEPISVHGFRSTFRDWCAESTNYQREIAEAALAHAVGGVEGAYQRGDLLEKRRALMAAWAAFCAKPAQTTGDVVPMRAATAA
jgi:integrase